MPNIVRRSWVTWGDVFGAISFVGYTYLPSCPIIIACPAAFQHGNPAWSKIHMHATVCYACCSWSDIVSRLPLDIPVAWNNLMCVALCMIRGCFAIWPPREFSHSIMHTVIQSMIHINIVCRVPSADTYDLWCNRASCQAWQSSVVVWWGGPTHLPH